MTEQQPALGAILRDYDPHRDRAGMRACVAVLQDDMRTLEGHLPRGSEIADAYLNYLVDRCSDHSGAIFVAEVEGRVVGFVAVYARVPPELPDQEQSEYAYVSDLVVLPSHRRKGLGQALMARAEQFARDRGASVLRLNVLARNHAARDLYARLGFDEYLLQLVKRFT